MSALYSDRYIAWDTGEIDRQSPIAKSVEGSNNLWIVHSRMTSDDNDFDSFVTEESSSLRLIVPAAAPSIVVLFYTLDEMGVNVLFHKSWTSLDGDVY